ncbi:MAG: hypothetical protein AAF840_02200 [Bacteroidota bacterium]
MQKYLHLSAAILVAGLLMLAACKTPQTIDANTYHIDRLKVLLDADYNGRSLEARYADVNLSAKGQSSRSENRWIVTYDTEKIKPEAMLKRLENDEVVLEAAFVKKQ